MHSTRRIVVLTGSETRHTFVRIALAATRGIEVLRTYCEGLERSLATLIDDDADGADLQFEHLARRMRSEDDFFAAVCRYAEDGSNAVAIPKGGINDRSVHDEIVRLQPDVVVAFGCSIVREPLLSSFRGHFLNAHLGLSPYYRGSGTNFWAMVNGEPELVGVTFMHIDAGVDTGAILHQRRADVADGDGPHQIGNRLIRDMIDDYSRIILGFEEMSAMRPVLPEGRRERVYRARDFSPGAVARLYSQFDNGLVESYLPTRTAREDRSPIVVAPEVFRAQAQEIDLRALTVD